MKRLVFVLTLSALITTGCSSEPSAEEKRNLFNKCIRDFIELNRNELGLVKNEIIDQAPQVCSYALL
jgi:PBP1b-binding outer membrane lipoprotein LpoB